MVVVVLTAGGALLALRMFNRTKETNPEQLHKALFSIKQQAGVMAALTTAIFAVVSALQTGSKPHDGSHHPTLPPTWGKRGHSRVVDLVDEAYPVGV